MTQGEDRAVEKVLGTFDDNIKIQLEKKGRMI
jgi:hypothetical protein